LWGRNRSKHARGKQRVGRRSNGGKGIENWKETDEAIYAWKTLAEMCAMEDGRWVGVLETW
jgi:hypothetical protein